MNILDKKFSHSRWFKGHGLTRKQAIEYFASNGGFIVIQKPSLKQSDNLFDDIKYDYVLKGEEGGSYRLTDEEHKYYLERKEFWNNWRDTVEPKYEKGMDYLEYNQMILNAMLQVKEYADYNNAFLSSFNKYK